MKIFLVVICLVLTQIPLSAQENLIVTELSFTYSYNRSSPHLPNYFEESRKGLENLKALIDHEVKSYFPVDSVLYHEKGFEYHGYTGIKYDSISEYKPYVNHHKDLIKENDYDLYLRFNSSLETDMVSTTKRRYLFSISTKGSNRNGKKVFKNSVKLPLSINYPEDGIASENLLSREDFYQLFHKTLPKLFSEDKYTFEWENLEREVDSSYADFLSAAEKYTLKRQGTGSPLLQDSIKIKVKNGWVEENEDSGFLNETLELQKKFTVVNPLLNEKWKVAISSESSQFLGFLNTSGFEADLSIKYKKDTSSNFKFTGSQLLGHLNENQFELMFEDPSNLMKIKVDSSLTALIQPVGNEESGVRKIYVSKNHSDFLASLMNLYQIYFKAIEVVYEARAKN